MVYDVMAVVGCWGLSGDRVTRYTLSSILTMMKRNKTAAATEQRVKCLLRAGILKLGTSLGGESEHGLICCLHVYMSHQFSFYI